MTVLTVEQVNDLCDAIKNFYTTLGSKIMDKEVRAAYAKMPPLIDGLRALALAALSERGGEQKPVGYLDWPALTFRFNGTVDRIGPMPVNAEPIPLFTRPQAGQDFAYLDEQGFYEVCQAYRHAPDAHFPGRSGPTTAFEAFEALKQYIRQGCNRG